MRQEYNVNHTLGAYLSHITRVSVYERKCEIVFKSHVILLKSVRTTIQSTTLLRKLITKAHNILKDYGTKGPTLGSWHSGRKTTVVDRRYEPAAVRRDR